MIIVGGSSSRDLAKEMASILDCTYIQAASTKFPDGECYTRIDTESLDDDVVIVQNTYPNDNLIEMFLLQDAVRRLGAKSVTLVVPYFGYARQDRVFKPGEPESAKVMCRHLNMGCDRIITIDPGMAFGTGTHETTGMCVSLVEEIVKPGMTVIDVGTGTGEIAFHVARTAGEGSTVVGVDITPRMLELAERKESELDLPVKIDWQVGDALDLQFPDGSFDLVTSGYMLRNVCDIQKAVSEMHRVLAPGGKVIVAELSKPKNSVIRFFYNIYMRRVKRYGRKYDKGKSIDGRQSAYEWLTCSIEGFPYGEDMVKIFRKAGFEDARFYVKSFGAVNIYVGTR